MKWHRGRPRVVDSSTFQDLVQKIMKTDYLPMAVCQLELELVLATEVLVPHNVSIRNME
jgi:hypothetical protein